MNRRIRIRIILPWIILLSVTWNDESFADVYTIHAGDIDYPLTISVPDSFRIASLPSELSRRDRNVSFYNDNPKLRGTYSEIFRSNWSDPTPFPLILVSTLGTTSAAQGKISKATWATLRKGFESASRDQIENLRRLYQPEIQKNYPYDNYEVQDELSWATESHENRALIMIMTDFSVDGIRYRELGARTVNYFSGYLVVLDIKIDATQTDALETIRTWVNQTKLISISP